jgi:quercetin dioxygenase-like cupin family protein
MHDGVPLSFAEPLPPAFRRTVTVLEPEGTLPYEEAKWRDALVVVRRGEIELECLAGGRRAFREGDILFLSGLSLRALHNPGAGPAVLVAVSRARADEFRASGGSTDSKRRDVKGTAS